MGGRPQRFEIVRTIGSGGMGVVYEAIDRDREGRVALKTMTSLDAVSRLRLKNEFRALADLDHPNLVHLGELLERDGVPCFTMELVQGVHLIDFVRPDGGGEASLTGSEGATLVEGSGRPGRGPASSALRDRPSESERARVTQSGTEGTGGAAKDETPGFDEPRLRAAFRQVAEGLEALHRAHRVHRDVKPSNVLVTEAGRVVILDFGLVQDESREDPSDDVVGTAHFMAPEQAAGKPVGPEADWYSFGVMLHIALTGRMPFSVSADDVIFVKQTMDPLGPSALTRAELPTDLAELCLALLNREPRLRPSGPEVLARLGGARGRRSFDSGARSPGRFVGRTEELATLEKAYLATRSGRCVTVLIEGESGMGKSALMRRFLDALGAQPEAPLILAGRCYERESVPFKAVDEVVDALGSYLSRLPADQAEALMPPGVERLAEMFPSLRRVTAVERLGLQARDLGDPALGRGLAFAALRTLLHRLAAQRPVVVAIDDLQWADSDGAALLQEVLRPPEAPPVLCVGTVRTGSEISAARRELVNGLRLQELRRLELSRLHEAEARRLAVALLAEASEEPVDVDVEGVLAEARGHPMFLDALVRHRLQRAGSAAPVRLDDALWARIELLERPVRELLEALAVAGAPLPLSVASAATTCQLEELGRLVGPLRAQNLARTAGVEADDLLQPYHDRVRETVLARLDAEARRSWHGRLARAFEQLSVGEPEVLATHWHESGDDVRARAYVVRAAEEAMAALAFDRAARLFRRALSLGPGGDAARPLEIRLGDALSYAGRGAEAAQSYQAALACAPEAEAFELRRRVAENYLRSGYFDEGIGALRQVVSTVGMQLPRSPADTLASLLARRAQLRLRGLAFEERSEEQVPPELLQRMDVCFSSARGLGMIDFFAGAYFQVRNLLFALDAGEPYRIARALALEAPFSAAAGPSTEPRVSRVLQEAQNLAERTGHPHALGLCHAGYGLVSYLYGRFRAARDHLDRAEATFREQCTGAQWERGSVIGVSVWNLWFQGDVPEFCRRVDAYGREADERGDRYLAINLRSYLSNARWLVAGEPALARSQAAAAIESWTRKGYHLQHFYDLVARVQIRLYEGDGTTAYEELLAGWSAVRRSLAMQIQIVRIFMCHLRGRAALAAAKQGSTKRSALLRDAAAMARALRRMKPAWARPLAASLEAALLIEKGAGPLALDAFAASARGFEEADMRLHACIAQRRAGELEGGVSGEAAVRQADARLRSWGIVDPVRLSDIVLPGL